MSLSSRRLLIATSRRPMAIRTCSLAMASARAPSRRKMASSSAWCCCCATSMVFHHSGEAAFTISSALGGANGSAFARSNARSSSMLLASARRPKWNASFAAAYLPSAAGFRVRTIACITRALARSASSSSSDSSRSAAKRAAVPSSTPRMTIASTMSLRVNARTTKPPLGSVSIKPSCANERRAARSGVRDTRSRSTSRSSERRSPGSRLPSRRRSRRPCVAFEVCVFG